MKYEIVNIFSINLLQNVTLIKLFILRSTYLYYGPDSELDDL